jgi:hypothetical protein
MKKISLLFLMSMPITLTSCEHHAISEGRACYKKYLSKTMKDPSSLVIYDEKYVMNDPPKVIFTVDYGGKNGFGAMARSTSTFETVYNSDHITVDGQFIMME